MNERIKQLVEKSYIYDKQNDSSFFNKEKFAELIVRECAETIQDFVDHRFPASEYPVRLKRYFGVEE
jgi:hypothetical protein